MLMILPMYAVLGSDGSPDSDPIKTRKHPGGLSLQNGQELIMLAVCDMRRRMHCYFLGQKNVAQHLSRGPAGNAIGPCVGGKWMGPTHRPQERGSTGFSS